MLKIDLRVGESLMIGKATVQLEKKSGQIATLVIDADKSVLIRRIDDAGESIAAKRGIFGAVAAT